MGQAIGVSMIIAIVLQWLARALKTVQRQLRQLINALSGQDRRENRRLMRHLSTLQAEHNRMRRQLEEKQRHASLEARGLRAIQKDVENERDDLQLQVWELEQQVKELLDYIAHMQTVAPKQTAAPLPYQEEPEVLADSSALDLSSTTLGIVGGHPTTRRAVLEDLSNHYGLKNWTEIPPLREATTRKNKLKKKLNGCDLIVIIADYMSHSLTHAIFDLQGSGALQGEVMLLNCHGKSGILRDILQHITDQTIEK